MIVSNLFAYTLLIYHIYRLLQRNLHFMGMRILICFVYCCICAYESAYNTHPQNSKSIELFLK